MRNVNIHHVSSIYGDVEYKSVRDLKGAGALLRTGIFQNLAISFTVLGLPTRMSGTFISIDLDTGAPIDMSSSEHFDRLCGMWFVLGVIHNYSDEVYTNDITAIKIYRYQKIINK